MMQIAEYKMFQLLLLTMTLLVCSTAVAGCDMQDSSCEFFLTVELGLTMMSGQEQRVHIPNADGKVYVLGNDTSAEVNPDHVILADGSSEPRVVILANNSMPGPALEVYENQEVIVHVTNKLLGNSIAIHWHGLEVRGTPWMDGTAFVTQCPILPGQSFTYKFNAGRPGTFFWHSHFGGNMNMGLFGPFIVKKQEQDAREEHVVVIQDYTNDIVANEHFIKYRMGMVFSDGTKLETLPLIDGSTTSKYKVTSTLINGRGRVNDLTGNITNTPFTVFNVKKGNEYRFRVIGANVALHYIVSVDNHVMKLIAIDGNDIEPITSDAFTIHSGERFDFILKAEADVGNYWIRVNSMIVGDPYPAFAIIRYAGASADEPMSSTKVCSTGNPCKHANCPYESFEHTICQPVDKMKSPDFTDPAPSATPGKLKEIFLKFGFGINQGLKGHVNGVNIKLPKVSALTQPKEISGLCTEADDCGVDKVCTCLRPINLEFGDIVQLNLLNMGFINDIHHPIHLHGYSFHVIKIGYRPTNATFAQMGDNLDIDCGGNENRALSYCNNAKWADPLWYDGNIPGIDLSRAPRKDTITVPAGGYAVVRFVADNPGIWYIHCHMEPHLSRLGMGVLFNGSFPQIPTPPKGFPECRDFPAPAWLSGSDEDMGITTPGTGDTGQLGTDKNCSSDALFKPEEFWGMFGALLFVILLQFMISAGCLLRMQRNNLKLDMGRFTN